MIFQVIDFRYRNSRILLFDTIFRYFDKNFDYYAIFARHYQID